VINIDLVTADVEELIRYAAREHPDDTILKSGLERVLRMLQEPEPNLPARPRLVQDGDRMW